MGLLFFISQDERKNQFDLTNGIDPNRMKFVTEASCSEILIIPPYPPLAKGGVGGICYCIREEVHKEERDDQTVAMCSISEGPILPRLFRQDGYDHFSTNGDGT
jgi:hypothetical protein